MAHREDPGGSRPELVLAAIFGQRAENGSTGRPFTLLQSVPMAMSDDPVSKPPSATKGTKTTNPPEPKSGTAVPSVAPNSGGARTSSRGPRQQTLIGIPAP